jgi:hypothetical protein
MAAEESLTAILSHTVVSVLVFIAPLPLLQTAHLTQQWTYREAYQREFRSHLSSPFPHSPFVLLWRSFRVYLCGCLSVWLFRAFCLVCCVCFEKLFPKIFHFTDKKVGLAGGWRRHGSSAPFTLACLSRSLASLACPSRSLASHACPSLTLALYCAQFPPRAESIVDPNEPPFEDNEFYGMGLGNVSEKVRHVWQGPLQLIFSP